MDLSGTTRPGQSCKDSKADEHAATKTSTNPGNKTPAQYRRNRTNQQSVGAVGYSCDCYEKRGKRHALKHGRSIDTQELWQKRSKKDGGLRIEKSNNKPITENACE